MTKALSGEVVDVAREQQECFRRVMATAQEALQAARDQRAHDQMVLYMFIAAAIALLVVVFIYRKPIRAALEALFIGAAAKTIATKKDLNNYRKDIGERIREKSQK